MLEATYKLDQSDARAMVHALENSCATLIRTITETGLSVPQAPAKVKDDDLANLAALEVYHAQLVHVLRPTAASTAAQPAVAAPKPSPAAAQAAASPAVETPAAELSQAEVQALTLTERVRVAQGKLTVEQARANIAARNSAKPAATAAAAPKKPESMTARVLAAKGCKTLEELREKRSMGHDTLSE